VAAVKLKLDLKLIAAISLRLPFGRSGANLQHAVETLDTAVGRPPRRFMSARMGAQSGETWLTPHRAISAQETHQWLE
jgi:hypothetical protein